MNNDPAAVADSNMAIIALDRMHHWHATVVNRGGKKIGYRVTITDGGRRVTGQSRSFVSAVNAALHKLHGKQQSDTPALKLVGGKGDQP